MNETLEVKVTATPNASARTKNRLRDHGPVFKDVTRLNTGHSVRHDEKLGDCVLLRSLNKPQLGWAQPWIGWLSLDEIDMWVERFSWPSHEAVACEVTWVKRDDIGE